MISYDFEITKLLSSCFCTVQETTSMAIIMSTTLLLVNIVANMKMLQC
jgi:hypothetical protein